MQPKATGALMSVGMKVSRKANFGTGYLVDAMQEEIAANRDRKLNESTSSNPSKKPKARRQAWFPTGNERCGQLLHLHAQEVTQPELSDVVGNILVVLEPAVR